MEDPKMCYEDGAQTIFLYTKGREGDPPKELQELLRYIESTKEENVVNDTLKSLHQMIEEIRKEGTTMLGTLRMAERERAWRDEGRMEGREEERMNTERERRRAESAEAEVMYLRSLLRKTQK